jgi:hypothetical protein
MGQPPAAKVPQPIDATALTFTLENDSFTVRIGRWRLRATSAASMNQFVDTHLREIDPDKITIYSDANAKYKTFQPVLEVLKKHDWLKFKLQDTNPKVRAPASPAPARST